MNFDLAGLFQKQSQYPVTDQNMAGRQVTFVAQQGNMQSSGADMNLSVGQIVSGQVVAVDGDVVQIELAPGSILQAKVEDGLALLKGMSVSFEVSGMSDKQVALRALFQNTANVATMNKALEAAELPVTAETTTMVNAMMKEGMPIDKSSLQAMYRQVAAHPDVSSADIVTMNRLEIPVTDANVRQFSNYMNMEHQIRGSVESIADSMTNTIAQLVSEGKVSDAAQIMRQFSTVFMQSDSQMVQGMALPEQTLQGQAEVLSDFALATDGETIAGQDAERFLTENGKIVIRDAEQANANRPLTVSLEELMRAVTEVADEASPETATGQAQDVTAGRMQVLFKDMEELGLSSEKAQQFIKGQLTGQELVDFTNQLLSKMAEKGNTLSQFQFDSLTELLQKPEMQNAIRDQMFEQWLMSPEDVADKQKVSEFYSKLSEQSGKLAEALKQIPGAEQTLTNQLTNVHQNVDFMNQLNQTMSYVQLPLKFAEGNAHGDLYVYTNKKNLTQNDGNVSAFLHLDMDHLGPVDVYVAMQNQKVSTQFYLRDDEMLAFIHENIGILNERLEQRGYQMNAQFSVKEKPGNVMEEIVEDHRENVRISTNSFDMRA